MWWLSKPVLESHLMCIVYNVSIVSVYCMCSLIRFIDSIHWFDSLVCFIDSIHWFDSLIRFTDSIHWSDSLIRFIDSIHWFDSLIRFTDSIHWFDSLIWFNDSIQGAPNPYFYRCKFSPCIKHDLNFDFDGKTRRILKGVLRSRAGRPPWPLHPLCVFLGVPSFDHHENP